jgi:hypothetical protein
MLGVLVLYLAPILVRVGLHEAFEPQRILLSLLPLPVVLPSVFLPAWISDERREHVVRHALYATAFTASVASVRWDVVAEAFPEPWTVHLVLYFAVGGTSLWWFALSHVLENRCAPRLYTHQGDVAVLPLTLVAIATFVERVPDEAFQFSRCVIFYVPVVVAWATLFFVAFNGFATSCTTTYYEPGFNFLAYSGLVIASAQLALIEMRASPTSFLFFPLVAAALCQVTPRPTEPPVLRPRRLVGTSLVSAALLLALAAVLRRRVDDAYWMVAASAATLVVPPSAGNRWVVPGTLYATLVVASFLAARGNEVRVADAAVLVAGIFCAFQLTQVVACAEDIQPCSPPGLVPVPTQRPHQATVLSRAMACLGSVPFPGRRVHGQALVDEMLRTRRDECPDEFAGVWWMRGNAYGMQLSAVHGHAWRDGATTFALHRGTVRAATLGGLFNFVGQSMCVTRVEKREGRWIRTPGWWLPVLRLLPCTYWLYMQAEDEMLRLVYEDGQVVHQYQLFRIARGSGRRTKFYDEYLRSMEGTPCF